MADHVEFEVPKEVSVTYGDGCTTLEGKVRVGEKPASTGTVWISWKGGQYPIRQGVNVQQGSFQSTFGTKTLLPREYEIDYHYDGDGDVKGHTRGKLTVTRKTLSVDGLAAEDKDYDGTNKAQIDATAAKLVGIVDDDDVELDAGSPNGAFDSPAAGMDKKVSAPGIQLKGADAGRYTLAPPTLKATIQRKTLAVAGLAARDKEYDATCQTGIDTNNATLVGVISPDDVKLDVANAAATFDKSDVGVHDVPVSGLTLTGTSALNYALRQPVLSACIRAKNVTATGITANDKQYDGTTAAELNTGSAGLSGVLDADSGSVTLDTSEARAVFASSSPGDKVEVSVSGVKLAGPRAHNYISQPFTTSASIWPPMPANFDLSMDLEKTLFRRVSEAAAAAKKPLTNSSYAQSELDLITALAKNPPSSQQAEIVPAMVLAAQKISAAIADNSDAVSAFAPVCTAVSDLCLFYSAAQEGSQIYGKLLAAAVYAKAAFSELAAELRNPNCFLGGAGDMPATTATLCQSLDEACKLITSAAAQPCAPSDSATMTHLQKKLAHIDDIFFELVCEVDRRRALIQAGCLVRIQAVLNQGLYFVRQISSLAGQISAESRDWRPEVESALEAIRKEVHKLTQVVESSQKCGGAMHYFQERIRTLDSQVDKASGWVRTRQPHANFDRWSAETFRVVDEMLHCETGRTPGLVDYLLQINTLVCQVSHQVRKSGAALPGGRAAGGGPPLHRLRFEGFPAGTKHTVRVVNTRGDVIKELAPDDSGEFTHPASPGEELRFVGLYDGIPFETITMKG